MSIPQNDKNNVKVILLGDQVGKSSIVHQMR
jgi:hypothetical protein